MDKKQALSIVEQGLELANKEGAFTMNVSAQLFSALQVLKQQEVTATPVVKKQEATTVKKAKVENNNK